MTDESQDITPIKDGTPSLFLESLHDLHPLYDPYPAMSSVGDRMIGISPTEVIFAVVVMETPDELILCHPTKLMREDDGSVTGKLMVGTPLMKMYKSSTLSVSVPDSRHKNYYYTFLLSLGPHLYGKVFTKEKLDQMRSFVGKYDSSTKSKRVTKTVEPIDKVDAANRGEYHFEVIPYGNTVKH